MVSQCDRRDFGLFLTSLCPPLKINRFDAPLINSLLFPFRLILPTRAKKLHSVYWLPTNIYQPELYHKLPPRVNGSHADHLNKMCNLIANKVSVGVMRRLLVLSRMRWQLALRINKRIWCKFHWARLLCRSYHRFKIQNKFIFELHYWRSIANVDTLRLIINIYGQWSVIEQTHIVAY